MQGCPIFYRIHMLDDSGLLSSGASFLELSRGRTRADVDFGPEPAKWVCSTLPRQRARAIASTVVEEGLTVRPCSKRVYQSTPIPARSATSSRRSPGVRRRRPFLRPRASADSFIRRDRRKSPNSFRFVPGEGSTVLSRLGFMSPRILPRLL